MAAIEQLVRDAPDRRLSRINALDFAARAGLDEERVIAAFLHAARIGLFELSWNVLCPGCGGVLDANTSLKSVRADDYHCALCAAGYEPTLDEMVERLVLRLNSTYGLVPPSCDRVQHAPASHNWPNNVADATHDKADAAVSA